MLTECGYGLRRAQIIMSGATVSPYLDGVLASTVFDIDATIAASYPGSGVTWANLAAPADGSAQAAYDFYRGNGSTSTTYPAFNGSAGSSAAYWSFDGNDHFDLKSGVNTPFLRDVHKTTGGSDFWIAMAFRPVDNGTTTGYFTTMAGTSVPGLRIEQLSNEFTRLLQRSGSTVATGPDVTLTPGSDSLYIVSHSHSLNETAIWLNSATGSTAAHPFSATTTDASAVARIGHRVHGSGILLSGTRLYSLAMGSEYLNNTKAAAIIAHLNTRHGRIYA